MPIALEIVFSSKKSFINQEEKENFSIFLQRYECEHKGGGHRW